MTDTVPIAPALKQRSRPATAPPTPVSPWREQFNTPSHDDLNGLALAGVRVAVKDLFAVAGHRVGAGNPTVLAEADIELRHSAAVQRLVDAGAVLAGIARTDELAFGLSGINAHEGVVVNPRDPRFLVGGSTSGPAAALLAGDADLGLGTDTAGSIRVPASYGGLWGLRMTHRSVDVTGMRPLAPSFDAVGLLARDLHIIEAALAALAPPMSDLTPLRILIPAIALKHLSPRATAPFLDAADRLAARTGLPFVVDQRWTSEDLEAWFASFRAVQAHEAWVGNRHLLTRVGAVSEEVTGRLELGAAVDPTTHRGVLAEASKTITARMGGALLCVPSASGAAPGVYSDDLDAVRAATLRLTCIASLAGLPALSIPAAQIDGQALGLCLVADRGTDVALTRFAAQWSP